MCIQKRLGSNLDLKASIPTAAYYGVPRLLQENYERKVD
jgi:hypothetical protein